MLEKILYWGCLLAFGVRAVQWRHRARKGLVLSLLVDKGEQSGRELKAAGAPGTVYNYLYELEKEGLVERRNDGAPPPGGIQTFLYRAKGTPAPEIQTSDMQLGELN